METKKTFDSAFANMKEVNNFVERITGRKIHLYANKLCHRIYYTEGDGTAIEPNKTLFEDNGELSGKSFYYMSVGMLLVVRIIASFMQRRMR